MINFFDSAYGDSRSLSEKRTVLESISHYGEFRVCDSESFDVVKKKINVYLGSQQKRLEGLMLLKTVSEQCPVEIFQQNVIVWMQMILKILQHHGESSGSRKLAYKILKQTLGCVLNSRQLKREASVSLLPALIDTLLESSIDDEWIEQAAECLSACIRYFPAACGMKKDKIEEFLILLLDRWELKEFEPIAESFAYLPAIGLDGSDKSSSFQKMWAEQFKQFLSVLNAILNFLYDGVENGCGDIKICSAKQLPPVPEEPVSAVMKLAYRFKAFGKCLSKMLVSAALYNKAAVPIDTLLIFLGRILSVSPAHMERNVLIYSALPSLYSTALTVIESLILSCDQQLVPKCHILSKFLTQVVKISFFKSNNLKDSLKVIRGLAYQVLQLHTERFKLFSVADNHREFLLSVILCDMKSSVAEVKLDKIQNSILVCPALETSELRKHPSSSRTSAEALKALKSMVTYGNLDQKNFQVIYISVGNVLNEIHAEPLDLPIPYSDENYRIALYSLLHTLSVNLQSQNSACLPLALSVFSNGLEDLSPLVRSKCQEILGQANVHVDTFKAAVLDSPSVVKESPEEQMVVNSRETYTNNISNIHPNVHHIITNEHSITNDSSACAEMMNGGLPGTSAIETIASQSMESNKSFHNELSGEPARNDSEEITVHTEDDGQPALYTNSNAYSPSEPEVEEEEEMDVEEEEMDVEEEEEEEEFKDAYANHNGYTSEDEGISEEEEEGVMSSPSKRPSTSGVQSNGPSPKKVKATEDHSDPDVSVMLQDFIPTSPDPES